jgi:hypothetical protein
MKEWLTMRVSGDELITLASQAKDWTSPAREEQRQAEVRDRE